MVLGFDDLFADPTIKNEPMDRDYAEFTWGNWRVESYPGALVEANPGLGDRIPLNADGSENVFYLTNFRSFGAVARTVTISHSKPFFLHSLDLYTFPDNGTPVTDPGDAADFFSSARFVSIAGTLGGTAVADAGVALVHDDDSLPGFPIHAQFRGKSNPDPWNQPVDRLEITLPAGQNLANPRFVMDNLSVAFVPAPPAVLLLGSALAGLAAAGYRRLPRRG